MRHLYPLCLLLLLVSCDADEKKILDNPSTHVFDSLAVLQKESWGMPGLALGVIKNDEIVYQKGMGNLGLDDSTTLTSKSLFHMASVSKPFVATAIMQLVEKGKVNLDDPLTKYMPYFKMADSSYQSITIRHVLTHTSGIPDEDDYEWYNPQYDDGASERYARSLSNVLLDFTPGDQHNYSNTAFDILANVISSASGLTFEEYMKNNILRPSGMENSTFLKPEVPKHLATRPHSFGDSLQIKVNQHYPYNRRHAPSSTLHSNVDDMLQWAKLNLAHGEIDGTQIFSKNTYNQLTTPSLSVYENDSIALGWFIRYVDSTKIVEHWGGDDGYLSYFGFIPDQGSALALMTNNDYYLDGFAVDLFLKQLISDKVEKEWKLPIYFKLKDLVLAESMDEFKRFYIQERDNKASKYLTANWTLNYLGYLLLDKGYGEKAEEVFKFNIQLEPENAVWHDSLGDCYRKLNKTALAIEAYQKALAIDPDQDYTRQKLDEITQTK